MSTGQKEGIPILWQLAAKIVGVAESAVRGEPVEATVVSAWGTDGVNPDGSTKYVQTGRKIEVVPKLPDAH